MGGGGGGSRGNLEAVGISRMRSRGKDNSSSIISLEKLVNVQDKRWICINIFHYTFPWMEASPIEAL